MPISRRELLQAVAIAAVPGLVSVGDYYLPVDDLRASACRDSFYYFVQTFWSTCVPEDPIWNWHIKYICNELQTVAERVFANEPKKNDLIINVSPGSTKSTLCSILFPAWIWTRMASARIIGGSYSDPLSVELSRKNRMVVQSDLYRRLFPEIVLRDDQNVKSHFATVQGGGRKATSVGGTITGFHAHFLIVDDPLNPSEAVSEVELGNANKWMGETLSRRKVSQKVTVTILIMQRLHQNDPTADMIDRAEKAQEQEKLRGNPNARFELRQICLPGELTKDVKPKSLRKYYKKNVMDIHRFPAAVLAKAFAELGEYGYAGQILQNPIPPGGGMFKTDRIIVEDAAPKKWIRKVRFWDKAGTAGGSGAFTVGLLMGVDRKNRYWILDVIRGRWSSEERENIIEQTAKIDGTSVLIGVEQEPGSGGKESAEMTVKRLAGYRVRIDKPSGSKSSKELRADPFSVQVNASNVIMLAAEWNRPLIDELRFFPASKYKDQADAGSGAFNLAAKRPRRAGALW